MKELAKRIKDFVSKYAKYSASDPEEFNGPDPYCMFYAAEQLERGQIPSYPNTSWESGCYYPYSSKEGRKEHNDILEEIEKIRSTSKVR